MKRSTWVDMLTTMAAFEDPLTPDMRRELVRLDEALFDFWNLGEKIVLVWSRDRDDLQFLGIPHYEILQASHSDFMNALLAGPKYLPPDEFDRTSEVLAASAQIVGLKAGSASRLAASLIDSLVTRYGVTLVRERAVVLLDAVGFSLRSPLEQMAMLNSLSFSINAAHGHLTSKDILINFARSTTGDGFYIWNRAKTRDANIALYKLMMLLLADNAIAHRKAKDFPVPRLRAAFHMGEHYEFYQVEALNPMTFGYIVGPVTIDLARMLSNAPAEQIVMGKFQVRMHGKDKDTDTIEFVNETAATLSELNGLAVGGDRIKNIRCYLTGPSLPDGHFDVASYDIKDKHGIRHSVYNAKINIHLHHREPIFLGIPHRDIRQSASD